MYKGDPEYIFAVNAFNLVRAGCHEPIPMDKFTIFDDECSSSIVDSAQLIWMSFEVDDGSDDPPDYFVEISTEEPIGDLNAGHTTNSTIPGNFTLVGVYDGETLDDISCQDSSGSSQRRTLRRESDKRRRLSEKVASNLKPHTRYVTSPTISDDVWSTIPANWDWRDHMPSEKLYGSKAAASVPLSQGGCGSCYAFGGITAMAYRFNIASNGSVNTVPSPEVVMSCANGCNGGSFDQVYGAMENSYIPSDSSQPYTEQPLPQCGWSGSSSLQLKTRDFTIKDDPNMPSGDPLPFMKGVTGERAMIYEVFKNGPGGVYVKVDDQFQSYSGDSVLMDKKCKTGADFVTCQYTSADTNHACALIGWGVDNGRKYWLVSDFHFHLLRFVPCFEASSCPLTVPIVCALRQIQNSWGPGWGNNGFLKLARYRPPSTLPNPLSTQLQAAFSNNRACSRGVIVWGGIRRRAPASVTVIPSQGCECAGG